MAKAHARARDVWGGRCALDSFRVHAERGRRPLRAAGPEERRACETRDAEREAGRDTHVARRDAARIDSAVAFVASYWRHSSASTAFVRSNARHASRSRTLRSFTFGGCMLGCVERG